jgi:hypothetical protein
MNEKKAKRTRQLVKHLMDQGAIAGQGWLVHNTNVRLDQREVVVGKTKDAEGKDVNVTKLVNTLTTAPAGTVFGGTVALDPACGRAIYQQMKKQAHSHRAS